MKKTSCGAYVLGLAAAAPAMTRKVFAAQDDSKIVAKEGWGRIEKLQDNFWAIISTPFDQKDFTTVCNGGIIAGKDRILAIESYMNPKGATWVARWTKKIFGRWPTDIVVTHYHADHSSGAVGFFANDEKPKLWVTEKTHQLIQKDLAAKRQQQKSAANKSAQKIPEFPKIETLKANSATTLDLGGRKVSIVPRIGHTASDVTIELEDPNIVYGGDLFFNRMIPNYLDADPVELRKSVKSLVRGKETIYVPGHGPVADNKDFKTYQRFLDWVEQTAREKFDAGKSSAQAAKEFELPQNYKEWYIFSNQVVPRAMNAWYREFNKQKN
jgi:glyoxylase-like metal-dependent hydrolase (beta-lactamase superfamily II)